MCDGVRVNLRTYLEEGEKELDEFCSQSLIAMTNSELIETTDSIIPTHTQVHRTK